MKISKKIAISNNFGYRYSYKDITIINFIQNYHYNSANTISDKKSIKVADMWLLY